MEIEFDREKFKKAVHYIVWKCRPRAHKLGSTKLNKILWLADVRSYVLLRRPMMGATYIRESYGPVARELMPVRSEMEREGTITAWRDEFHGKPKDVFRTRAAPDLTAFSQEERQILNQMIEYVVEQHTAASISEESHDYVWEIAEMGEAIPYHAYFASRLREPNEKELAWANKEAHRLGLVN